MLECVINISEGRDRDVIDQLADAAGRDLLDVHSDAHHHRSVFTLLGENAARAVTARALDLIDIGVHRGVHPRIGTVDVVPFVPLGPTPMAAAVAARDRFGAWAAESLAVPVFTYGTERTLPQIRRHAWKDLAPTFGPSAPHPRAGAIAAGARPLLVAYNIWIAGDLAEAQRVAAAIRQPGLRALGLPVGERVQVSMNLVDPLNLGPAAAADSVARLTAVEGAELVGLVPAAVLDQIPPERWPALDLSPERTIEARIAAISRL